jgi:Flp pilus assembly protein TadB
MKLNLIQYVLIVLSLGVILIGIAEVLHGRIFNGITIFVFIILFFYMEWKLEEDKRNPKEV